MTGKFVHNSIEFIMRLSIVLIALAVLIAIVIPLKLLQYGVRRLHDKT